MMAHVFVLRRSERKVVTLRYRDCPLGVTSRILHYNNGRLQRERAASDHLPFGVITLITGNLALICVQLAEHKPDKECDPNSSNKKALH
jgi:hypothetical protein